MVSAFFRSLSVPSTTPSRRSFVAFSVLAGVGLPVLAGCDLPGASKAKDSASANGSASAKGKAKAGSTDWQKLDAHIMGHNVTVEVSPVIRKNDTTSIMALELTRAKDDASIDRVKTDSSDTEDNKLNISS